MSDTWQPYREPLRSTLVRTLLIALVAGAALTAWSARWTRPVPWTPAVALMLWPAFGGHWVELWFLNWLRPRLPTARSVQVVARLGTWFLGGCGLGIGMVLTARFAAGIRLPVSPAWWKAGVLFIGVELIAHSVLQTRGQPSFFNGRG